MELGTFTKQQYNGNISGTIWKSAGDGEKRKYDFDYDAVNRILSADFNQYTGSSFNKNAGVDFSMSNMSYDANGNIMSMNQKGLKINTSPLIDQLSYTYQNNSNKLSKVEDVMVDKDSKLGDFKYDPATKQSTDYDYDANGNLKKDNNKSISSITYNYLNLPSLITITGKGTITYNYDAGGNKLKKVTVNNTITPAKTTTTLYMGGTVYADDQLQFIAHEEGRIRALRDGSGNITSFTYDYFLKDHLGNVRMVLTEEEKQDQYPAATFEDANIANEQLYYDNVNEQRTARPGAFYTSTTNGSKVQLLRKSVQSKGAGQLLKVMAGDKLHIKVDYYIPSQTTNNNTANGLNTILNALASIIDNNPATGALHGSGSAITTDLDNSTPFTDFLAPQTGTPGTTLPKAYLNIIFFDEQFKFVSTNSEAVQVTTEGSGQTIYRVQGNAKEAAKNGYVYIYVSNESDNLVYFDNLQVTHERGPVLEETHYYPFGLTMAGISSKALSFGGTENKYKWNKGSELQNKEFSDGSGLELYATNLRSLDPQLGRWWQIDSKPDYAQSLYSAMGNNPIRYNDPVGDTLPMPYSNLAANYPTTGTPKEMYNSVGGQVAKAYNDNESKGDNNPYANTCALRMSTALNKSGNDINTDVKNSKGEKMYTLEGSDGKDYALRKSDIKDYMKGKYGKADISTKSTDKDFDSKVSEIKGQKGVIVYDVTGWSNATGHVTIYDGKGNCGHDCYFPDSDKIKQENAQRQSWNAANPNEKQLPMVKVTGVSIWIAK